MRMEGQAILPEGNNIWRQCRKGQATNVACVEAGYVCGPERRSSPRIDLARVVDGPVVDDAAEAAVIVENVCTPVGGTCFEGNAVLEAQEVGVRRGVFGGECPAKGFAHALLLEPDFAKTIPGGVKTRGRGRIGLSTFGGVVAVHKHAGRAIVVQDV